MEFTQLSLARGRYRDGKRSIDEDRGEESGVGFHAAMNKRKWNTSTEEASANNGVVDLHQLKNPLPSDWEQCLDLQSGRMYYVNRKTSTKSWNRPEVEQKLDLELNISTTTSYNNYEQKGSSSASSSSSSSSSYSKNIVNNNINNNNNMVALACSNCHLLVILCRSSPSCPNCKYVHSLSSKAPINWPL
ncbi:hypothetical protein ABFX02_14G043300 [Erythranthe guttata]